MTSKEIDLVDKGVAGHGALDVVMRAAHTIRQEAGRRSLTAPECAVLAFEMRLREAGWNWGPDGPQAPAVPLGRVATLADNPRLDPDNPSPGWKLHRCADGAQCRSEVGGGCARGWCAHFDVCPDEAGVPRFAPLT